MIELAPDAPGRLACGRSGLPLLARCACGHRRTVPFRLLKTHDNDTTPLRSRPFRCPTCRSTEPPVLFAFDDFAEFDRIRADAMPPRGPTTAPTSPSAKGESASEPI